MSYGQKRDFQDGGRRHLKFLKIQFLVTWLILFNICCSVANFIKIGWVFTEIWWSSKWRPSAILDLLWRHNTASPTHFRCANIVVKFLVDRCCSFRDPCNIIRQHKTAYWLYITDHGNFEVAHALCHVTLSRGVQNNHSYEFFDPYLPIHYATFMCLRWRLRGVLRGAFPLLSDF